MNLQSHTELQLSFLLGELNHNKEYEYASLHTAVAKKITVPLYLALLYVQYCLCTTPRHVCRYLHSVHKGWICWLFLYQQLAPS